MATADLRPSLRRCDMASAPLTAYKSSYLLNIGNKKRDLEFVEGVENLATVTVEKGVSSKKKRKDAAVVVEEMGEAPEEVDFDNDKADIDSLKTMERRKKRKSLDKERHMAVKVEKKLKSIGSDVVTKASEAGEPVAASSTSGLPEFNVGVFKDLAPVSASVREAAVVKMVRELREIQKAYDMIEDKETFEGELKLEAKTDDGLNDCAPSLRYAVRRLIRGVSSSRECARQGFTLGLTALLSNFPCIKVDSLMKLIDQLLEVSSSLKGQEVRDCLLGRLFSYGAIARSGRLTKDCLSDKNLPLNKEFMSVLISLSTKKRFLQEPAVAVILDLVEKLPTEVVLQLLEAPGVRELFEGATNAGNPDALHLALKIQEKISVDHLIFGILLPHPFSTSKFFTADHLSSLVNCFKESAFCQPRVHSVWPVLVNMLLPDGVLQAEDVVSASTSLKKHKKSRKSSSSEEENVKSIKNFVEVAIEGSLLLSSHDRKHLAFDILLLLFPRLPAAFVSIVLSQKIVQCLIDVLSTKDSWLYKIAQNFVNELSDWAGNDDVRRVAVIVALQKHSNGKFDNITRTKTVKTLMSEFKSESGSMLFIQNLTNMFVDEGHTSDEPSDQSQTTDENSEMGSIEDKDSVGANSDSLKTWAVESLPCILKYLKLDSEAMFRVEKEILKFLTVQGLFSASLGSEVTSFDLKETFRWPRAGVPTTISSVCIEQIQLLLASARKMIHTQLILARTQKMGGLMPPESDSEPNDLWSYFMFFLSTFRSIPSVSLFRTLSDEDEKAFNELLEMETRLSREKRNPGPEASKLRELRYLLIQLLLQMLIRPGEFAEAVSEVIICCKKAFPASDVLESSEEDESDTDPELIDVLVDTLLSLLPQSSAPMRYAIEQVFKHFCNDVTNDGLLRMLRVIKKDLKPARRQKADSADQDDDDLLEIEEEEDGDEEIDEAETGGTGDSEGQTDDSETHVKSGKYYSEDSDESDEGMDDDAMFRMDSYIAQIFKEKKKLAGSETAQSQLVLFKLRVLSLLEIYLHENPSKPEVLTVYSNLAQAYANLQSTEITGQLGQRIWGVLQNKILKAKQFPRGEGVELSVVATLLEKNLKMASKSFKRNRIAINASNKNESTSWKRHKMLVSLAQNSTVWILRIIDARKYSESELEKVFDILKDLWTGYFESKKSQVKSDFLREIFRRWKWTGHHLLGFLFEKCGSSKSDFRRVEALDLVMEILKSVGSKGTADEESNNGEVLKTHLLKLSDLVKELVSKMPEKQSRQAEILKFCIKVFQLASTHDLKESFLNGITPTGHNNLLGFLLDCGSSNSEFRRVEALDLVIEILKSMVSKGTTTTEEKSNNGASKKVLETHLLKLSDLVNILVSKMPKKQSRRAEILKFCIEVFQLVSTDDLKESFLKGIMPTRHNNNNLLGFLLDCGSSKSEFRRVEALDLVMEILKSVVSKGASKKVLETHLLKLSDLVNKLVRKMPKKQSRRAEILKFCIEVFQIVSTDDDLKESFLEGITPTRHDLLRFLLECGSSKSEFRRVGALDLVMGILESMVSEGTTTDEDCNNGELLKTHLLSNFVKKLGSKMPKKQSRVAEIWKFCFKLFLFVSTHDLEGITPESQSAWKSQLGDLLLEFKRQREISKGDSNPSQAA